ncbi:MAG: hypothetical protein WA771_01200 [Chthoniobacterales bacterium]
MKKNLLTYLAAALAAYPTSSTLATPVATSGEFRLNTTTSGNQDNVRVAWQPGGFVTSWDGTGASLNVFTSGFTNAGVATIAQRNVNFFLPGTQRTSAIAARPDGSYVVAFEDDAEDDAQPVVAFRRFDAAGQPQGINGSVGPADRGRQRFPDVAQLPGGNFAVVWNESVLVGNQTAFQIFSQGGQTVTEKIVVNTSAPGAPNPTKIAADGLGRLIVVWEATNLDQTQKTIAARIFSGTGVALTEKFVVKTDRDNDVRFPSVAADAGGNFVVVWETVVPDAGPFTIAARRFNASAEPIGVEFAVGTGLGADQTRPVVAMGPDQTFVVAFEAEDDPNSSTHGVFLQQIDFVTGVPIGTTVRANEDTVGDQAKPAITVGADGRLVVVWQTQEPTDEALVHDLNGRTFTLLALPPGDVVTPGARPTLIVKGRSRRLTSKAKVRIRGRAADDQGVAAVEFKTRGKFRAGPIRGKERWTLRLRVKARRTTIKFRAVDEAGQFSKIQRVVVRRR